ncbi:diphthine--ammonia ligase [Flavobacteriales bacterium AH-315-E23]|nr:diphthine--ammonia ligase [Flavobacteriales bacterium AH-315-E23]
MKKALFNWSGGKDSSICLYKVVQAESFEIATLLTTVSEKYQRISQHGVRVELLEAQADSLGLKLHKAMVPEWPTMESYNELMAQTLQLYKDKGIDVSIFGDIFLEDLRKYREEKLAEAGFRGVFPLWKIPTDELAREFIELGFKAVIVCVDENHLDESFAGREFDEELLRDLPDKVDPCGEHGEFHTFVYEGPIFKNPILFEIGEVVYRKYESKRKSEDGTDDYECGTTEMPTTGFWYCDLISN